MQILLRWGEHSLGIISSFREHRKHTKGGKYGTLEGGKIQKRVETTSGAILSEMDSTSEVKITLCNELCIRNDNLICRGAGVWFDVYFHS